MHNETPIWRHIEVRPSRKFLDHWGKETIRALQKRRDELAILIHQGSRPGKPLDQQLGSLLLEGCALEELLEGLRNGQITEVQ
jgi:hypothetical protein